jgi:predicted transposase/invertase (TIGR01784 family)
LYNGSTPYPDYTELRLSDAFKDIDGIKLSNTIPLELIVQVYNINHGHNSKILEKCKTLDNYSFFVDKIRKYEKQLTLAESLNCAIKYCTENDILKKFLEEHGSEVFNMLLTEWNWDDALEVAREEGLEEGMERGIEFTARNALAKGIPVQTVQEITGLDLNAIETMRAK